MEEKNKVGKIEELIKKVEELKKSGSMDISTEEDLSVAIMNLIGIEEHFYFTAQKTGKPEYYEFMDQAREERKKYLAKLLPKTEGEAWCLSKHLLSTTMRLIEVGTKLYHQNKKDEAKELFDSAYKMYSMFWALRFKVIDVADVKVCAAEEKPWTVNDIVNKLVDCCNE